LRMILAVPTLEENNVLIQGSLFTLMIIPSLDVYILLLGPLSFIEKSPPPFFSENWICTVFTETAL